jgi:hypothetical protein
VIEENLPLACTHAPRPVGKVDLPMLAFHVSLSRFHQALNKDSGQAWNCQVLHHNLRISIFPHIFHIQSLLASARGHQSILAPASGSNPQRSTRDRRRKKV